MLTLRRYVRARLAEAGVGLSLFQLIDFRERRNLLRMHFSFPRLRAPLSQAASRDVARLRGLQRLRGLRFPGEFDLRLLVDSAAPAAGPGPLPRSSPKSPPCRGLPLVAASARGQQPRRRAAATRRYSLLQLVGNPASLARCRRVRPAARKARRSAVCNSGAVRIVRGFLA